MKNTVVSMFLVAGMFALLSCEAEKLPAYVEGWARCGQCTQTFNIKGDLDDGGEKYYGYCETSGDDLNFVVGTDDKAHVTSASDFYLLFKGIKGPAVEGTYADQTTLEPKESITTFTAAEVKNVNAWGWTPDQASSEDLCRVDLFSMPADGELTPQLETFEYFVKITCFGLDDVEDSNGNGINITSFEAELWFDGCD